MHVLGCVRLCMHVCVSVLVCCVRDCVDCVCLWIAYVKSTFVFGCMCMYVVCVWFVCESVFERACMSLLVHTLACLCVCVYVMFSLCLCLSLSLSC